MPTAAPVDDLIQPFQVELGTLRGRLVRLGPAVDAILGRHDYPEPVATILGEFLVLAAVIGGAFKFDGLCTLQTKSDGPVNLMVADFASPGILRGYARFDARALEDAARPGYRADSVPRLLGAGHLVLTVDQGPDSDLYQGYVDLEGASLADCAHAYFRQSEQLEAGLRLAARRVGNGGGGEWRAGGLMVQRFPPGEGRAAGALDEAYEDAWRQTLALVGSLRDDELTDPALAPNAVLYSLFHECGVRVFHPVDLATGCRCSRARIERLLASFDAGELADMVVDGRVTVTCEFCNAAYAFDEDEVAALVRS